MKGGNYLGRDLLPFAVMVIVEFTNVGSTILFKSATTKGMSYLVYMVYTYFVSSLFSFCVAFLYHRKSGFPEISRSLLGKIFVLTMIGFMGQILGYKGIAISDPTLASAISNLTPAFTFALAVIFRMEKLSLTSGSSQAKIIGTVMSIAGAFTVVLYTGPAIITPASSLPVLLNQSLINSPQSGWVLGGFLLIMDYLLVSVWYIFQAQVVKNFQAVFVMVCMCNICAFLIATPVCIFLESDLTKWRLKPDSALIAILYSGAIGSIGVIVHTWALRMKGPVYVASFRPLSIVIAALMGFVVLGSTLYLGCVIGAVIISVGFYVVMWGKVKEEDKIEETQSRAKSLEDSEDSTNVPLLH